MKNIIKQSLEKYFSLPPHFIREEADLYILAILSIYFKEGQAKKDGITISDVDPEKLMLSRVDLKIDGEDRKVNIHLKELLKHDLPTDFKEKAHFRDKIGHDGFTNHLLTTSLCVMEISDQFNCDFMEFLEDENVKMTVNELIQFVLRKNFKIIQN